VRGSDSEEEHQCNVEHRLPANKCANSKVVGAQHFQCKNIESVEREAIEDEVLFALQNSFGVFPVLERIDAGHPDRCYAGKEPERR
jgi:hypothetical protein